MVILILVKISVLSSKALPVFRFYQYPFITGVIRIALALYFSIAPPRYIYLALLGFNHRNVLKTFYTLSHQRVALAIPIAL